MSERVEGAPIKNLILIVTGRGMVLTCVCVLKNDNVLLLSAGVACCSGLRVCVVCEEMTTGNLEGKGWSRGQLPGLLRYTAGNGERSHGKLPPSC